MNIGQHYKREKFLPGTIPIIIEEHSHVGDIELHWHDFYEFELIVDGVGETTINGKTYPLKKGSFYFLKPSDYHKLTAFKPLCILNIMLSDFFIEQTELPTKYKVGNYCITNDTDYNFLVTSIHYLKTPHTILHNKFALNLIECFYIILLREIENENLVTEVNQSSHVQRAILHIHSHLREEISLNSVAAFLHLNPNYFSQIFHKETGKTFQRYLSDTRIDYAKNLLRNRELSISDVCFNSGFNSLSTFLHTFKNKYGYTPSQFRKEN